ncbi:camphor resistance protein CrcB [Pseudonocardia sp. MH-G8]|nr:camphor resistance protein CrcB [Pseudonocardia sp. MH-G8]
MLAQVDEPVHTRTEAGGRIAAVPEEAVLAGQWPVLAAVAAGGALGALARWGVGLALPTPPGAPPWPTLGINVAGCLLMGLLLGVLSRRRTHPLLRPFAGTGVLGGFTTFSGYAVDGLGLPLGPAAGYLAGTLAGALVATSVGSWAGRRAAGPL